MVLFLEYISLGSDPVIDLQEARNDVTGKEMNEWIKDKDVCSKRKQYRVAVQSKPLSGWNRTKIKSQMNEEAILSFSSKNQIENIEEDEEYFSHVRKIKWSGNNCRLKKRERMTAGKGFKNSSKKQNGTE